MKNIIKYLFILLLLFVYATTAVAVQTESVEQQLDKADKAYEAGDYDTALKIIKPLADTGNLEAQYELGKMYFSGRGVKKSNEEAAKWYLLSAKQGNALAQNDIGIMYKEGRGVKQDDAEALMWLTMSAKQGSKLAQKNLAIMYEKGDGVQQNDILAYAWYSIVVGNSYGYSTTAAIKDKIKKTMTPSQIKEAEAKAEELKKSIKPSH